MAKSVAMSPKQVELLDILSAYTLPVSIEDLRDAYAARHPDTRALNRPSTIYRTIRTLEDAGYLRPFIASVGSAYPSDYTISGLGMSALRAYKKKQVDLVLKTPEPSKPVFDQSIKSGDLGVVTYNTGSGDVQSITR